MGLKSSAAKKFASLTAIGAGALAVSADSAQATAVWFDPTPDPVVGFGGGGVTSHSATFGAGTGFRFQRALFTGGTANSIMATYLIRFSGLNGLQFAGSLGIFGAGALFGANPANGSGIAASLNFTLISWTNGTGEVTNTFFSGGSSPASYANQFALFRFIRSGQTHFGWVELSLDNSGPRLTIHRWAYEDVANTELAAGDTVGSNEVPEPSSMLMTGLGALALGATGLRRWRKAKQQPAA